MTTDRRDPLDDMGSLWRSPVVPLDDPHRAEARRAPTVDAIVRAIRRASEEKRALRRRRWALGGLAVAAAVMLAFGLSSFTSPDGPVPVVTAGLDVSRLEVHAGRVEISREGRVAPVRLGETQALRSGDVVVTRPEASGTVALSRDTRMDLAASTRLGVVSLDEPTRRVRLEQGHLGARVNEPKSERPRLVVETPHATVVVVGTVFTVDVSAGSASEHGFTAVAVMRGTVAIERDGVEITRISAGQTWTSAPTTAAASVPVRSGEPSSDQTRAAHPAARRREATAPLALGQPKALPVGTLAIENELFARAMAARNAGQDEVAVRLFDELLSRYPASPLAADARLEQAHARERIATAHAPQ